MRVLAKIPNAATVIDRPTSDETPFLLYVNWKSGTEITFWWRIEGIETVHTATAPYVPFGLTGPSGNVDTPGQTTAGDCALQVHNWPEALHYAWSGGEGGERDMHVVDVLTGAVTTYNLFGRHSAWKPYAHTDGRFYWTELEIANEFDEVAVHLVTLDPRTTEAPFVVASVPSEGTNIYEPTAGGFFRDGAMLASRDQGKAHFVDYATGDVTEVTRVDIWRPRRHTEQVTTPPAVAADRFGDSPLWTFGGSYGFGNRNLGATMRYSLASTSRYNSQTSNWSGGSADSELDLSVKRGQAGHFNAARDAFLVYPFTQTGLDLINPTVKWFDPAKSSAESPNNDGSFTATVPQLVPGDPSTWPDQVFPWAAGPGW